ncbi:MAG: phosphopantetheine-containing protein [Ramlibacter sp.]|nr:phosphopantetheine-containing protein [Ramlibacter sp.]MDF2467179.1 phosphopantetheine-containing protein [Ramlibacter sp.]
MTMNSQDLIDFLRNELHVEEPLDPGTPLFSTGLLDSVAMLNVIAFVEERAKITVSAGDVTLENFDTPERIATYVDAHR